MTESADSGSGFRLLQWVMHRSWALILEDSSQFAFSVYGQLSRRERRDVFIGKLLKSMNFHFPKPWLQPVNKCLGPRHGREQERWDMDEDVRSMDVCWSGGKVEIATRSSIVMWSMVEQRALMSVPHNGNVWAICTDGKQIVSGSIRLWNAEKSESIGDPMRGHNRRMNCVAFNGDGKEIVSGSTDKTVRRWHAETGEVIEDVRHAQWEGERLSRDTTLGEGEWFSPCGHEMIVLPANMSCIAVNLDIGQYCIGLDNGEIAICFLIA